MSKHMLLKDDLMAIFSPKRLQACLDSITVVVNKQQKLNIFEKSGINLQKQLHTNYSMLFQRVALLVECQDKESSYYLLMLM